MTKNLDDYVKEGVYGIKEIKPDEKRKFLGTLRERVVIALTQQQVRESGTYIEVENFMKQHPKATLFLNGTMNYKYLSDYLKLANEIGTKILMSTNKEYDSELGLVLAYDYAIDKEDIYVNKESSEREVEEKEKSYLLKIFKKLF